jgi:hypothetical protein
MHTFRCPVPLCGCAYMGERLFAGFYEVAGAGWIRAGWEFVGNERGGLEEEGIFGTNR